MNSAAVLLIVASFAPVHDAKLTVYAYQANAGPRGSHTFATLDRDGKQLCISWMPEKGGRGKVFSVPGRNWNLKDTLDYAKSINAPVSAFGPYKVNAGFADAFAARVKELESGCIAYTMLDNTRRHRSVCCVTAVGGIDPMFCKGFVYGNEAARLIVRHFHLKP